MQAGAGVTNKQTAQVFESSLFRRNTLESYFRKMLYSSVMQNQRQGQGDLFEQEPRIHINCYTVTIIVSAPQPLERPIR